VLVGWILGSLVAILVGLIIGKVNVIRIFAEPFLKFIRFIPPIAFITLFLVWFGIGAEMIASNEGVGYLIWNSRLFFRTDWIFVGLFCLGFMGFFTERLLGWFGRKVLFRYGVVSVAAKIR